MGTGSFAMHITESLSNLKDQGLETTEPYQTLSEAKPEARVSSHSRSTPCPHLLPSQESSSPVMAPDQALEVPFQTARQAGVAEHARHPQLGK